jgi:predicted DsbA family dithiol-disulfide isomerase
MCIEVFADVTCPFTHVGLRRLASERARRGGVEPLVVRAWPLEWINGAGLAAPKVEAEIAALEREIAPELFAGFDADRFPATSIPAFGLSGAAYDAGDAIGEAVALRIRDALFEEGRDISDERVLRAIGAEFGIVPPARSDARAYAAGDWDRGRARGVVGSPHFFVRGKSWFCPTLVIGHTDDAYTVSINEETRRKFYAAAFGAV